MIEGAGEDSFYPILWMQIPDPAGPDFDTDIIEIHPHDDKLETDLKKPRFSEFSAILDTAANKKELVVAYSTRSMAVLEAMINIARTLFVTVVLAIAAIFFNTMTNKWVLLPIERMLEKVRLIAKNPLAVAQDDVAMAGVYSMMQTTDKEQAIESNLETAMLEQAITKIGALLAVGFGDAGTNIIAQNVTSGGDMNPMMPGTKTYAIFGFCDIHHFNDVTEVLQTEIMTFVNQIAEVTHSNCSKNGGAANKNIGEAFLLVWKYKNPEEFKEGAEIKNLKISLPNK